MSARAYTMATRGAAAASTRAGILGALIELATERLTVEITLDDVAGRAGVSARTVLRHFGDRDGLLDAATEAGAKEFEAERDAPTGDLDGAIRAINDHYEKRGDFVIRLLAQEHEPRIGPIVATGRLTHRRWVIEVFAPDLPTEATVREAAIDLLVVATDVYAWKLLRRDRGLPRHVVEERMRLMAGLVLEGVRR